ncbi:hypothetical protein CDD83_1866 [Cordyceps sp. RAO-2017]|nr:hypothetical protein CDD83_1866 [Cordyceps sp. RAO-2017]
MPSDAALLALSLSPARQASRRCRACRPQDMDNPLPSPFLFFLIRLLRAHTVCQRGRVRLPAVHVSPPVKQEDIYTHLPHGPPYVDRAIRPTQQSPISVHTWDLIRPPTYVDPSSAPTLPTSAARVVQSRGMSLNRTSLVFAAQQRSNAN